MNDNGIIKALEYCINNNGICEDCLLLNKLNSSKECTDQLIRGALALIKRQKAEIERLKKITESPILGELVHVWKNEAIVSFAEKIKKNMRRLARYEHGGVPLFIVGDKFIDELAKESTVEVKE